MSVIGTIYNKVTSSNIPIVISASGEGFKRLTGPIGQRIKNTALATVKERFENGKLFNENDMKYIDRIVITNMNHESEGDPNAHYSVQGESATGIKVKGGHVAEDASKQTQAR